MSLFSSLNLAKLSLEAHQAAIQTVGQNIANATTEGYARQRVEMRPTPANDFVFAQIGTGVRIDRIGRLVDQHLEDQLRDSRATLAHFAEENRILQAAGTVFNDLDGGGLSAALGRFFDALEDLAASPEDPTARTLVLDEGRTLADTIRFLDARLRDLRRSLDEDVAGAVDEVNSMLVEIAALNSEIVAAEDGGIHIDTANDLRTRRDFLVGKLSDIVPVTVIENSRGAIQVISGSNVLVAGSRARPLTLDLASDGDITQSTVRFAEDGLRYAPPGGRLDALVAGRDSTLVDLRAQLDEIARGFLERFNAVHAAGEGLARLSFVRATNAAADRNAALSGAGFPFAIRDGAFTLQVVNEADGTRQSYLIPIDADGLNGDDTTLVGLAAAINAALAADNPEITASITADGFFEIRSTNAGKTFTFRDDQTNFLAAAGMHGFFSGTNARDIAVSAALIEAPLAISTGRGAGAGDNSAVQDLLGLRDEGHLGAGGMTFEQYYGALIGAIGSRGAEARELLANQEAITEAARNQRESLSGVNIDEEAITLIQYQRAYQGSARFLTVVDRLLETLINSV